MKQTYHLVYCPCIATYKLDGNSAICAAFIEHCNKPIKKEIDITVTTEDPNDPRYNLIEILPTETMYGITCHVDGKRFNTNYVWVGSRRILETLPTKFWILIE